MKKTQIFPTFFTKISGERISRLNSSFFPFMGLERLV